MILETLIEDGLLKDILNTLGIVLDNIKDDTVSGRALYDKCAELQLRLYNQIYAPEVHSKKAVQCEINGKTHVIMQYINNEEEKK